VAAADQRGRMMSRQLSAKVPHRHGAERLCLRDSFSPFGSVEHIFPHVTPIESIPPVG
jgi:hypothetical protein